MTRSSKPVAEEGFELHRERVLKLMVDVLAALDAALQPAGDDLGNQRHVAAAVLLVAAVAAPLLSCWR